MHVCVCVCVCMCVCVCVCVEIKDQTLYHGIPSLLPSPPIPLPSLPVPSLLPPLPPPPPPPPPLQDYESSQLSWEQRELELEQQLEHLRRQQRKAASAAQQLQGAAGSLPDPQVRTGVHLCIITYSWYSIYSRPSFIRPRWDRA